MNISFFGYEAVKIAVNSKTEIYKFIGADRALFSECRRVITGSYGYSERESYDRAGHIFGGYAKDKDAVFVNFFDGTGELTLVRESDSRYFSYCDAAPDTKNRVAPEVSQIHLEDFGMSYAIRLSDGRYILIDGGRNLEPDVDRLYECVRAGSPYELPVIAAWILTHPHSDHYHAMLGFMKKYGSLVKVEKVMFNFPEADDLEHYPKLVVDDDRFDEDVSEIANIPKLHSAVKECGAEVYIPRTGQTYKIGDAVLEILISMDDTIGFSTSINASSLVIRMELGGQVILFATDSPSGTNKLPYKYGNYLKADILQAPHHGFGTGDVDAEILTYELVKPKICMLPVSEYNGYKWFCTFQRGTRYLFSNLGVDEMILGDVTRTLTLPYTAPAYKKEELKRKYLGGIESNGSTSWVFSGLNTSRPEDFEFTVVNTTNAYTTLWIELLFEDKDRRVRDIKTVIPYCRITKLNIVGDKVDGDALYFNWQSLKGQGIPENVEFAVRFLSDEPLVIAHKDHKDCYHASVYR